MGWYYLLSLIKTEVKRIIENLLFPDCVCYFMDEWAAALSLTLSNTVYGYSDDDIAAILHSGNYK